MSKLRLQKILANAGICSRRKAEVLLIQKRVEINGKTAKLGDKADPISDEILLDKHPLISSKNYKLILLNKPKGIISTCKDPQGRITVLDLIPEELQKGLHIVGRLDLESRGAILLSNYGELTMQLTHPRYAHTKTYHVLINGIPSKKTLRNWSDGVILDGKKTMRASIELLEATISKSLLEITLVEGRNRQIRRVSESFGHRVIDLKRTAIGKLELNNLKEGSWRKLEEKEWKLPLKTPQNTDFR